MSNDEVLSCCSRCHRKFVELGEVIEYGKHYPAVTEKYEDGTIKQVAEHTEIKEALCKECMIEFNKQKYDHENITKNNNGKS